MSSRRFIALDTETTGLNVEEDHRLIEIGCVNVEDFQLNGDTFHKYLNPEREVDQDAFLIHGKSLESLQNEPLFGDVVDEFLDYIRDSDVVVHNAIFDLTFLDYELQRCGRSERIGDLCNVIDSLELARKMHVNQGNSLDALCKRYHIDASKRGKRARCPN